MKLKQKLQMVNKAIWQWFKREIWKPDMIVFLLIAETIFWSPVIITFIMGLFNPYWFISVGAIIAFWAGPFTPAMPLQMSLAYGLKKLYQKVFKCKKEQ